MYRKAVRRKALEESLTLLFLLILAGAALWLAGSVRPPAQGDPRLPDYARPCAEAFPEPSEPLCDRYHESLMRAGYVQMPEGDYVRDPQPIP